MDMDDYFVQANATFISTFCVLNVQRIGCLSWTKFSKMSYCGFFDFKLDAWLTSFLMYSALYP
jgi:hypothetical protein